VKDYVDKIAELETECERLKSLEEDFKVKEKKLITDMKKKGDLARQMLSEKDTYIQQILSNNDSGSNNGNSNSGKGGNNSGSSSSSSSSSSSGGGGGVQGNTENYNTTSTTSSSSAPSNSTGGQRLHDSNPSPAPSTTTTVPLNQSSSNPSSSTTPYHQSQSQSQGRVEGREGRVGVGSNRSGTLTQTDHDQQAYLKQAFCGFVKAKEPVEMEHLGILT
jgi:hypothetical protein